MILLDELLRSPQTWFTVAVAIIIMVAQFLFVGEKAFIPTMWFSSEKKAERIEAKKDEAIIQLTKKVDELSTKYDEAIQTIHEQTLEIQKLTLQSQKNNQILDAIKKWMEESKIETHFIELLRSAG
jgi:preprotein translocase subunit SecF